MRFILKLSKFVLNKEVKMDLILMLFFCYKNYRIAKDKEEPPFKWAVITAIVWVIFEFTGVVLYSRIAGVDLLDFTQLQEQSFQALVVILFGIACAYLGYLLVRRSLLLKNQEGA